MQEDEKRLAKTTYSKKTKKRQFFRKSMFYHDKTIVSEAHATTFSYFLCSNDRPKSSKLLQFAPKGLLGRSCVFCFGSQKPKNRVREAQQPIPKTQGRVEKTRVATRKSFLLAVLIFVYSECRLGRFRISLEGSFSEKNGRNFK